MLVTGRYTPGFLKSLSCGCRYALCARVCVCVHPQAVRNNSHEMKPGIQVVLYSGFFVQDLLSIELIGVALVTKRIAKGG